MAIKFVKKPESEPTVPAKKTQDLSAESLLPAADAESMPAEKSARPKGKKAPKPDAEKDRELF